MFEDLMSIKPLLAVMVVAYIVDLALGDPESLPHPVRWMGRFISFLEKRLRRFGKDVPFERKAGLITVLLTVSAVWYGSYYLLAFVKSLSLPLFYFLNIYFAWTAISVKSLSGEAGSVMSILETGKLPEARERLSRIVGRDTDKLTDEGVSKAVVETVSENTSDGIVAPLFFMAIGGVPLALAYKAVNTLDSMIGYKNERYIDFGRSAAKLDDIVNFVPARLTAYLMVLSSGLMGLDWRNSLMILRRDGRKHPSPNAGLPEAAVAGALGLRLGGPTGYGGRIDHKPYIGEKVSIPDAATVGATVSIMHITGAAMLLGSIAVLTLLGPVLIGS